MIAAHLLDENSSDHSLQSLSIKHLNAPIWKDEWKPYEKSLKDLTYLPENFLEPLTKYNNSDVKWTNLLELHVIPQLKNAGLMSLYRVEMENLKTLAAMTCHGIPINRRLLNEWERNYQQELSDLTNSFTFNPNSSAQVLRHLQQAGYSVGSTGAEVLSGLHGELPTRLLRYRRVGKILSTYLEGLRAHISPVDGRIHPRYHQNRTVSGRLSSSDPNGQNFPRDTDSLPYRQLFCGTWGLLTRLDFNQLELRIGGHYSKGELAKVYHEDRDIHDNTGERIWRKAKEQISDNERVVSKVTNFTALYDPFDSAIGSVKLQCEASGVPISWSDARSVVTDFRGTYPDWWTFVASVIRQVYNQGWVRADSGRIRRAPGSLSNFGKAGPPPADLRGFWKWAGTVHEKPLQELLRSIVNSLVQGLAADITKLVGTVIDKRLRARRLQSRLCCNVHDELLIDTHPDEAKEVARIAWQAATNPPTEAAFGFTLGVPLLVDISQGETWSDCKKNKKKENKLKEVYG